MKKLICIVFSISLVFHVNSQNLVPNPSFEDYINCPTGPGQMDSVGYWNTPHNSNIVANYYNTCNYIAYNTPNTGEGYVGFIAYRYGYIDERGYVQIELLDTLVAGETYYAEMWTSLRGYEMYTTDGVGMCFSAKPDTVPSGVGLINVNAQIFNDGSESIDHFWHSVKGTFIAEGGEKYLTIGDFRPDSLNKVTKIRPGAPDSTDCSYYMIDDVLVEWVDRSFIKEEYIQNKISVFPNPFNNYATLQVTGIQGLDYSLTIYDITGRLRRIYSNVQENELVIRQGDLNSGLYYFILNDKNGYNSYGKFVIQ